MKYLVISATGLTLLAGCGQPAAQSISAPETEFKTSSRHMLTAKTKEEIAVLVRTAFYDKTRLMEILCEEMYEPGELDRSEVSAAIDAELLKWSEEKKAWPEITDCDRLDTAFSALEKRGILALHNTGLTQSDGHDDFREALARHPNKPAIVGYCFYHGQDVERAIHGGGLYLAFGPVDPKEEQKEGPKIGLIVREELERAGLQVQWDGTFGKRIHVPKFLWQRR
jgi:hypothetical protein